MAVDGSSVHNGKTLLQKDSLLIKTNLLKQSIYPFIEPLEVEKKVVLANTEHGWVQNTLPNNKSIDPTNSYLWVSIF